MTLDEVCWDQRGSIKEWKDLGLAIELSALAST